MAEDIAVADDGSVLVVGWKYADCTRGIAAMFHADGRPAWSEEMDLGPKYCASGFRVAASGPFSYFLWMKGTDDFLVSYLYLDKRDNRDGSLVGRRRLGQGTGWAIAADVEYVYVSGVGIPESGGRSRSFLLKVRASDLSVEREPLLAPGMSGFEMAVRDSLLYSVGCGLDVCKFVEARRTEDLTERWLVQCCEPVPVRASLAVSSSVAYLITLVRDEQGVLRGMIEGYEAATGRRVLSVRQSALDGRTLKNATADADGNIYVALGPAKFRPDGSVAWVAAESSNGRIALRGSEVLATHTNLTGDSRVFVYDAATGKRKEP